MGGQVSGGVEGAIEAVIAQAEALLRRSTGTQQHTVKVSGWEVNLFDDVVTAHGPLRSTLRAMDRDVDYAHDLLVDVFSCLWLASPDVRKREDVLPSRYDNHSVILAMMASPDVEILRTATVHDDLAAAMGVVWLSESIRAWLKDPPPDEVSPEDADRMEELIQELRRSDGMQIETLRDYDELSDLLSGYSQGDPSIDGLGLAAGNAHQQLSALQDMALSLGLSAAGDSRGSRTTSTSESWATLQKLDPGKLRVYAQLIGRFKLAATRRNGPVEEIERTEFSDRLWDVDSAELATRRNRLLRLEHLERVANSELLTHGRRVQPTVGGPMVLVMDESWSMDASDTLGYGSGPSRLTWSKAFAAAMVHQARSDGREVAVISFSSKFQQKLWEITDTDTLVSYLAHDWGGETSYEQALDMALGVVESSPSMSAADIVLVTDDDRPDVPGGWLTRWSTRRAAVKPVPPRLRGVGVGVRPGKWLTEVADDVVMITDFTSDAEVTRAARRH